MSSSSQEARTSLISEAFGSRNMASSSKKARVASASDAKVARLQAACAASGGASNVVLQKVIAALDEDSCRPSLHALREVRTARFRSVCTTLHVDTKDGKGWDWPLCHPNLLLAHVVSESQSLQQLFRAALGTRPCSKDAPWSLTVGYDEFVPGNKLQPQPARKDMNLQFSFLELGNSWIERRWDVPRRIETNINPNASEIPHTCTHATCSCAQCLPRPFDLCSNLKALRSPAK